jgi:DNA-binding response OmpR family regulator
LQNLIFGTHRRSRMHSGSPRTLSFSGYVLDLQRCALMHGDQEIQLRPKSFDVLR